jgi:hypothetical protein
VRISYWCKVDPDPSISTVGTGNVEQIQSEAVVDLGSSENSARFQENDIQTVRVRNVQATYRDSFAGPVEMAPYNPSIRSM